MTATASAQDLENTLYLDLKDGRVIIDLRPDLAPKHVKQIKMLTRDGFYNGLQFHRVIPGFMAQGGDPKGDGTGGYLDSDGAEINLPAEFNRELGFERGIIGMARTSDPNSASSQFFIMFAPAPHLDGQYTVWGQVSSGMEFVDNIKKGDVMKSMQVASDAK